MKILLSLLLYINKNYEDRILTINYISNLVSIGKPTVSKELKKLEELGYIKVKVITYKNKNIILGKKYYVQV